MFILNKTGKNRMKILAIGAHPDDIEIFMYGILSIFSKRNDEISSNLKKLGLTVGLVKISTRRGSVEDSFYVKKMDGKKLLQKNDINLVKESLKTILL